jgi:hypothetical protein
LIFATCEITMSFLAPYMLWGALAAGIPVALHFFYRSRYRDVPWAAMKYLLAGVEQTSRRLRFQELLLLSLRVAVLVLLALALARPSGSAAGRGAGGDAVDAVLVIDNSLSMGARAGVAPPGGEGDAYLSALREQASADGSVTRLDRARAAALAVLANLPAHSTVQVIALSDRAVQLGPQVPSHLDQARRVVQQVKLTHRGTDFLPGIDAALDLLERGSSPNKELYLFSDMQRRGWEAQGPALLARLRTARGRAGVYLVHCATQSVANVAVAGITPQSALRSGERADFAVLVRNTGDRPVRNLTVSLEVDGKSAERDSRPLGEVKPGETRAVLLSGLLDRPGPRWLRARVGPDDLAADNTFDQIVQVRDRVGVLVVDGAPDEADPRKAASFFLEHALNPGQDADLPVRVVGAAEATPRLLAGQDVCVLVNTALEPDAKGGGHLAEEFVRALAGFVQDGHGLMIFAGDRVSPATYNRVLFERHRLLPGKVLEREAAPARRPWTLDRGSAEVAPFDRFRREEGYAGINGVQVRRILHLAEKDMPVAEARVLLRTSDGRPCVASRRRPGQGEVMLFTTSANDPAWTDLFVTPAFVPIVQVALNHLLDGRPLARNREAGETLTWSPPRADAERAFDLVRPDGSRVRLGHPRSVQGRLLLTSNDTDQAGVYRIVPAGASRAQEEGVPFAVTPDLRESAELETLTPEQIEERLGFRVVHLTAGDEGSGFGGAERLRREWTVWLLGGLLMLVLTEAVLAWFCGRAW